MKCGRIFFVLFLLLAGCATGYHSLGFTGGYSDIQLSENSFKVSFVGNGHTLQDQAVDFALLRSSDISLRHGFKYFVINGIESHTRKSYIATGYGVSSVTRPRANVIITCYHKKPFLNGMKVYNAVFLSNSIRKRYGLRPLTIEADDQEESRASQHVDNSINPQKNSSDKDNFIAFLIQHVEPKPLRKFISLYRSLYAHNGKEFFEDFLSSSWYVSFKEKNHRNPVVAIIDQRHVAFYSAPPRHVWMPINGGLNFYFVPQPWAEKDVIQSKLTRTGKISVVVFKNRALASEERYFQMKHADDNYVTFPGHLEGADAVLLLTDKKSPPQPLAFQTDDGGLPFEIADVVPIFLHVKLISLSSDEILWTRVYPLDILINKTFCHPPGPGLTGTPTFFNSCYSDN